MASVVLTLTDQDTNTLDLTVDFNPSLDGTGHLPFSQEVVMKFLALFEPDRIAADKRQLKAIIRRPYRPLD